MLYSPVCIDETAGFTIMPDGSMKPNKIGRNVWTLYECDVILCFRYLFGDLRPEITEEKDRIFFEKIRQVKMRDAK